MLTVLMQYSSCIRRSSLADVRSLQASVAPWTAIDRLLYGVMTPALQAGGGAAGALPHAPATIEGAARAIPMAKRAVGFIDWILSGRRGWSARESNDAGARRPPLTYGDPASPASAAWRGAGS